ncbi:MAG: hypothetical protein JSV88_18020 [Candidatus Aminicenantes bacterium]|nr:MAG: hypothetical protein JSV88_18020 [Candidatus Aminicenantes bacterium]
MSEWLITNNHIEITGLEPIFNNKLFKLYHKGKGIYSFDIAGVKISIIIDGYVLPQLDYADELSRYTPGALIKELYIKYHLRFINYIKGNFIIIIVKDDEFYIFNDRIGIRKFFYYVKDSNFIFSNRFKLLSSNINREVDCENLAIYSLMNQFIDGLTFLKDVFYSRPSSRICFDGDITFDSYWNCEELLNQKNKKVSYENFSEKFIRIIKSYINYLDPDEISLTLTGGLDSRTILAALLHLGVKPSTFTYGDPYSGDGITAKKVAQACGLDHKNYFVKPSVKWFSGLADKIIDKGNSIAHIHRAHRLFAVENPNSKKTDNEILFCGYMGGELLRNFCYDGIVISDFTKGWINEKLKRKELIINYLEKCFLNLDNVDINRITKILSRQKFSGVGRRMNEFFLTFLISADNHHAQDLNLFSNYKKYPVPIYLDFDFLELIFGSKFNFFYSKSSHHNYINRINSHELYCHLIYQLFPRLASIPLAKIGYYTPKELVEDNRSIFLGKRVVRRIFANQKYPVNFSLDEWMKIYVGNQLEIMQNSEIISNIINIKDLIKQFNNNNHRTYEKYWRKFTNPIFFSKLINYYLKL